MNILIQHQIFFESIVQYADLLKCNFSIQCFSRQLYMGLWLLGELNKNNLKKIYLLFLSIFWFDLPNARHYNPPFISFLPYFRSPFLCFQAVFFGKFCPYVWLVFKSGF